MTSSVSHYNVPVFKRNMDQEDDNPFRPGSELSREAEVIVNLIKEGKPITPTGDMVVVNSANVDDIQIAKQTIQNQASPSSKSTSTTSSPQSKVNLSNSKSSTTTNSTPIKSVKQNNGTATIDVQTEVIQTGVIVPPSTNSGQNHNGEPITVEQVKIKNKRKCCTIQ